jgi:hypothetical protein
LAYADHADHKGKNIWPSVATISEKTGYKERSTQMITKALSEKGFLVQDGKGPKGTNRWFIPLDEEGVRIAPAKNAPPQKTAAGGAKPTGRGVHTTAPESLKPPEEPSVNALRANQIPEVVLYRKVTKLYPPAELFEDVILSLSKIKARLGRDVTCDDLLPFRKSWVSKGYNRFAITWLQWAETGQIPANGLWTPNTSKQDQSQQAIQNWLDKQEVQNG